MADIWLTAAAASALDELRASAPTVAAAVAEAISEIPAKPGRRLNLPGAPPAEPFLAKEPSEPSAPAVIYRRATTDESGDWLVVALMDRGGYGAAERAERELATYPPAIRELVYAAVAGSVSTFAHAPSASSAPGGAIPSVGPGAVTG